MNLVQENESNHECKCSLELNPANIAFGTLMFHVGDSALDSMLELMENDKEVVDTMRELLYGTGYLKK